MTYILNDVLKKVKSLFMATPLSNTPASPYLEAISRLRSLPRPGKSVYAGIERIYSLYPNIEEYCEMLEDAIDAIRSKRVFNHTRADFQPSELPLRKWYLNKQGEFIDPDHWFERFIDKACELLSLYEQVELEIPESVAMERSRERLLLLVNNIVDISNR